MKRRTARLCDEYRDGDGKDPRFDRDPWQSRAQAGRKARQLCCQVREALHQAMASSRDEVVRELTVADVREAPNSGHLLVLVHLPPGRDVDPGDARASLAAAHGYLRARMSESISRRYAPEISFEIV